MDYALAEKFASYLSPGESVRWTGQPRQGVAFRAADILLIPFSILWCGFAIFWELGVSSAGLSFFSLWGIPFVLAGLYIVFGRFAFDAYRRSRTFYALTAKRALILRGGSLNSIDLQRTAEIEFKQLGNGRGTIRFGARPSWPLSLDPWHAASNKSEFFQTADATSAYRLIQEHRS